MKKEYWLLELGFFTLSECKVIKSKMDGKTFMNFEVVYSNSCGNYSLGFKTDYEDEESKIRKFFISALISVLVDKS